MLCLAFCSGDCWLAHGRFPLQLASGLSRRQRSSRALRADAAVSLGAQVARSDISEILVSFFIALIFFMRAKKFPPTPEMPPVRSSAARAWRVEALQDGAAMTRETKFSAVVGRWLVFHTVSVS